MTQGVITMEVRKAADTVSVIEVDGEVTGASEESLTTAYNKATEQGAKHILVDFSRLDYMNSSGIGLLVTLLVRANRQGQRMLAYGLNEHYRQIFELTRLDEAIGVHDSEEDALAAVGGRRKGGR